MFGPEEAKNPRGEPITRPLCSWHRGDRLDEDERDDVILNDAIGRKPRKVLPT